MTTELQALKMKKRLKKASPKELERLKVLLDGEPLSAADLENAKKREEERLAKDKADYKMRMSVTVPTPVAIVGDSSPIPPRNGASLDVPAEHPRIAEIKAALEPFTKIEAHDSRPDEFVLFSRGISITAGDVRKARKAMKL